jgi:hypothetical protein
MTVPAASYHVTERNILRPSGKPLMSLWPVLFCDADRDVARCVAQVSESVAAISSCSSARRWPRASAAPLPEMPATSIEAPGYF